MNGCILSISSMKNAPTFLRCMEATKVAASVQKAAFSALSYLSISLQAVPLSFAVESLCILGLTFLFLHILWSVKREMLSYIPLETRRIASVPIYHPRREVFFEEPRFLRPSHHIFRESSKVHPRVYVAALPPRLDRVGERRS